LLFCHVLLLLIVSAINLATEWHRNGQNAGRSRI
jgi:hypothetical protein